MFIKNNKHVFVAFWGGGGGIFNFFSPGFWREKVLKFSPFVVLNPLYIFF